MKSKVKTSAMLTVIAVLGVLALGAAPALAAWPGDYVHDSMQIDPDALAALQEAVQDSQPGQEEYPVPPCEVIECEEVPVLPGEGGEDEMGNPGDEVPGDIGEDEPGDNPDNPGFDGGDDEEIPDEPLTPDTPDQPLTPETPEQPAAPQTPPATSSKLPNTGSTLLVIGAAGLAIIAAAFTGRRMVLRRMR